MTKLEKMWAALLAYLPQAIKAGHGDSWAKMCSEKTADAAHDAAHDAYAADAAADAADAAYTTAVDAAYAAVWAQIATYRITKITEVI